jgi:dihydropyrimidine dehydrogenase (NAD+) subunit PreA
MTMSRATGGKGSHGGYCGPAVKPDRAEHGGRDRARSRDRGLPISGIGGVTTWRDAAGVHRAGRGHGAGVHGGHGLRLRIVQDMIDGLSNFMDSKGYASIDDFQGKAVPTVTDWQLPQPQPRRARR